MAMASSNLGLRILPLETLSGEDGSGSVGAMDISFEEPNLAKPYIPPPPPPLLRPPATLVRVSRADSGSRFVISSRDLSARAIWLSMVAISLLPNLVRVLFSLVATSLLARFGGSLCSQLILLGDPQSQISGEEGVECAFEVGHKLSCLNFCTVRFEDWALFGQGYAAYC
ncbi:hypothetical protein U1Q18_034034 [Sarracenia purpurea var. burkii]